MKKIDETKESGKIKENEDALLMQKIVEGDSNAFDALVNKYSNQLHVYLVQILHSPELAEDALQDTWLNVWKNANTHNVDHKLTSWIYSIAQHVAIDILRKEKRYARKIKLDEIYPDIDLNDEDVRDTSMPNKQGDDPTVEEVLSLEKVALLRCAIAQLNPKLRQAIEIVWLKEETYQKAAEELNKPVGTIKSEVYLAKKKIEEILHPTFSTPESEYPSDTKVA